MAEKVHIDPAVLRQLAAQHKRVGDETVEWAKPPQDWLDAFPHTYGTIASPVLEALTKYYNARQQAGNALAEQHYRTAAELNASADEYERADRDSAAAIHRSGDGPYGGARTPTGVPPLAHPGAQTPGGPGNPGAVPPVSGGSDPNAIGGQDTSPINAPGGAPATVGAPGGAQTAPGGAGAPLAPAASATDPAAANTGAGRDGLTGTTADAATRPGAVTAPTGVGAAPIPTGTGGGDSAQHASPTSGTGVPGDAVPVPLPTPFAAAVAAAKDRETGPGHVVNEAVNEDLVIARTLLAAVLAAVDEPVIGLAWAVSVMRGPTGIGVFITSNEGRGWLPAGLYLPREVSTPWLWDEMLGAEQSWPWEGVADPARVLAEFGRAWGGTTESTLTALVSSGSIDSSLRAQLPDTAVEDMVPPAYDIDLRTPAPGTADRLALAASIPALESVGAVPDSAIHRRRTELAEQAHGELVRTIAAPAEAAAGRALRGRVLALLRENQQVPAQLWQELRDADDLLAATMLSRRVDAGRVTLGQLRIEDQAEALRAMVFERRCTELVLLLANQPTRQGLRDAVYAHEQILGHPMFAAVPVAAATTAADQVTTVDTIGPRVAPPAVSAGPPSGVSVAPLDDRVNG
ncbi:type VII secretion target [Nocardia acidivorans]|uniref:type VII secretion target n=1 Tax=Nocardia acidivorans TaxID=404580 RepID=UPI00082AD717|nr:type VII secretion target [Nocardia acidivorans]